VEYIVWHTAADGRDGGLRDTTMAEIAEWHAAKGWGVGYEGVQRAGYHFLVRRDGTVERGRPLGKPGAHVRGLNSRSVGICFSGHGDLQPLTEAQLRAGVALTVQLLKRYGLGAERVIGHREVNRLVEAGVLGEAYRVAKTCPGKLVDMGRVRALVRQGLLDGAGS
jgi:N-acetylmuramoyl-L-alanine amidase